MNDLATMLEQQLLLQVNSFGKDPTKLEPEERMEFIRWNVLALITELTEMLDETGWKPWASSNHVNNELALKEMIDAWHFFMNLMLVIAGPDFIDITNDSLPHSVSNFADAFTRLYMEKRQVNADRQTEGYTGLDKCPSCHRDRATTATETADGYLGGDYAIVCPCGHVYEEVRKHDGSNTDPQA